MAVCIETLSKTALKRVLIQKGVIEHIADNFFKNEVTGEAFLKLSEDDIKELCPLIGVRPLIRDIMRLKEVYS